MNEFEKCTVLKDGPVSYSTNCSGLKQYGKGPVEQMMDKGLLKLQQENAILRQQIDKMKNCMNCKHGYWDCDDLECRLDLYFKSSCNNWQMKGAEIG